jgi:hypothetical protein
MNNLSNVDRLPAKVLVRPASKINLYVISGIQAFITNICRGVAIPLIDYSKTKRNDAAARLRLVPKGLHRIALENLNSISNHEQQLAL